VQPVCTPDILGSKNAREQPSNKQRPDVTKMQLTASASEAGREAGAKRKMNCSRDQSRVLGLLGSVLECLGTEVFLGRPSELSTLLLAFPSCSVPVLFAAPSVASDPEGKRGGGGEDE
jgi:hypothetical protein